MQILSIERILIFTYVALLICYNCCAQDNYEIQIYASETVPKGFTMVELHSNFSNRGFIRPIDGVIPTDKAFHETVEITQGINPWMELGFYLFTSANKTMYCPAYVGDHLRWRVRNPVQWHWPLGVSLSIEAGYQRRQYCADDWNTEIRPIIDKDWKKWYVALNPVLDYSFKGINHSAGLQFSPQFKIGYKVTKHVMAGIEYYGSIGSVNKPDPLNSQANQLGIAVDLDVSPKWEFNMGYLIGLSPTVEKGIFKIIIGRRFGREKKSNKNSIL